MTTIIITLVAILIVSPLAAGTGTRSGMSAEGVAVGLEIEVLSGRDALRRGGCRLV